MQYSLVDTPEIAYAIHNFADEKGFNMVAYFQQVVCRN